DGDRHRRNGHGREFGDGDGAAGRRDDLRRLRRLPVALCRLLGDGDRRLPDRLDLQAFPEKRAGARGGAERGQLFFAPSKIHDQMFWRTQAGSGLCSNGICSLASPLTSLIRLLSSGLPATTIGPKVVPFISPS